MFFVRPIARDDLPAVLALSELTGHGLTTLPANRERLASRIERSLASFAGGAARADACYVFVLVDATDRRVVGIAAIEAAVGLKEPWYNYHVGTIVHASRALDVYTVAPTLFLANDHTGHTELCSLFLDSAFRHGRNGPLLAKSRLLFIAEFAERFAPKVIAELRGSSMPRAEPVLGGTRPAFLRDGISTADYLTGIGQKRSWPS
jgi:arginine N-succinyltransferase